MLKVDFVCSQMDEAQLTEWQGAEQPDTLLDIKVEMWRNLTNQNV